MAMLDMENHHVPFGDQILEDVREDIRSLRLAPQAKLKVRLLEQHYNVGQSPIREALSALVGEGLVVRESRRGFRVKPASLQDFDDLTQTRITLETAMLQNALTHPRDGWHEQVTSALGAILSNDHQVGDVRPVDRKWERDHRHYHFTLIDAYRSPLQTRLLLNIYTQYDRYRLLAIPRRAFLAATAHDHRDMCNLAGSGDFEGAKTLLSRHIRDTSTAIRSNIQNGCRFDRDGYIVIETPSTSA
jgi:GntR family carbon starvation induced transcriptional regulator